MLCEQSIKDLSNTNTRVLSSENLEKCIKQMQEIIDHNVPLVKEGE
jgi:hypothetical protein